MDLRVPTIIKFLNRLKSGTAAGNKSYLNGESKGGKTKCDKLSYST